MLGNPLDTRRDLLGNRILEKVVGNGNAKD
jgi:hypothetical protein